uniref:ETS domain-containing protein n=1 Tax=Steinernema glaseri TaxID=37863 RepID=A0A1I7Y5R6_9BILA
MKKFSASSKFEQDCPAIASSPPPSAPFPFHNQFAATTTTSLTTEYFLAALACNTQLEYTNLGLATSLGLAPSPGGAHLLTGQQPIGETTTQVVGFPAAQTSTVCAQVSPPPPGTAANNTGTALSAGGLPVCPTPTTNLVYPQPSPFLQSPSSNILPSAFSIVTAAQSSASQGLQSSAGYNADSLPSQLVPPNLISSPNNHLVAPNSQSPQANSNVITNAAAAALYPQLMCLPALFDRLTPAILRSQMSSSQFKPIPNNERVDLVRFRLSDPKDWAMDDVVAWMLDVARRNSIPLEDMNMQKFASCNGPQLLAMNELEFKHRDPAYGSLLFCELRKLVSDDSFIDELLRTPSDEDKQQTIRRVPLTQDHPAQCGLLSPGNPLSLFGPTSPLLQSMNQQLQPPQTQTPHQMQHSPIASKPIPVGVPQSLPSKFHLPGPSSSSASFDSTGCDELHGVNLKIRKNKDGRPRKRSQHTKGNKLWEFIRDALKDPSTCPSVVRWEDPIEGVFRIVESEKLARLWGEKKNNQKMTYEKLSRAMRTYYEKQILVPVPKTGLYPKKLVYKFGPGAHGWSAPSMVKLETRSS